MLKTVEAVIEAVGGDAEAAKLAGVRASAVSNWKARGRIASGRMMVFTGALAALGKEADPAVFGMTPARPEEVRA
jgi:DNA-binding transcriptional regulator YdaS (Cro superfamily)